MKVKTVRSHRLPTRVRDVSRMRGQLISWHMFSGQKVSWAGIRYALLLAFRIVSFVDGDISKGMGA